MCLNGQQFHFKMTPSLILSVHSVSLWSDFSVKDTGRLFHKNPKDVTIILDPAYLSASLLVQ